MLVSDRLESEVRSYCRIWPTTFESASGSRIRAQEGRTYLDFFAGAGALNYGHNPTALKAALLEYIGKDGVTHALDMHTVAKESFLQAFDEIVLRPRGLVYKVQFPGPNGASAVESALKLARKVTGRRRIISFTGGFHGMSLGALAVTGNIKKRRGAGVELNDVTVVPFDGYLGDDFSGLSVLEKMLDDAGSGLDSPAGVIVETVQGEGGVNVARREWLRLLAQLCRRHGILLIVDDVQMGVGRTGPFFSFEHSGIVPDIVCLSKSISGYGLPMALTLIKPEHDLWEPGEHNGTFRGFNPAFVTGAAALREYWSDGTLEKSTAMHARSIDLFLNGLAQNFSGIHPQPRGVGLVWGMAFEQPDLAAKVSAEAFSRGLLVETAGAQDQVLKIIPPLTVSSSDLEEGLSIIGDSIRSVAPDAAA